MQNIFVLTHAQSQHRVDNRVGGWFDTSLTELGRLQAQAAAKRLKALAGTGDIHLVSSDLNRAAETAEIVGQYMGLRVELDAGFRENSYGQAEGQPQAWLDKRMIVAPRENRLDHAMINGAESKREFATRIYQSMSSLPNDKDVIIVSHGYALTFIIAAWIGLRIDDVGFVNFSAKPAGITHLQEDDLFANRAVKFLNDTAHLKGLGD